MMATDGSHLERRLKNMVPKRKEEKEEMRCLSGRRCIAQLEMRHEK